MRVLQFFFRFIKGFLLKLRGNDAAKFQNVITKLDTMASTFSNTRRVLIIVNKT